MGSTILKNLTKVNLVASYSVSTIKNGDFEDDIIYYYKSSTILKLLKRDEIVIRSTSAMQKKLVMIPWILSRNHHSASEAL